MLFTKSVVAMTKGKQNSRIRGFHWLQSSNRFSILFHSIHWCYKENKASHDAITVGKYVRNIT